MTTSFGTPAVLFLAALCAACTSLDERRANVAGNRYLSCLHSAADEYVDTPTGAEQIASAAHSRCWAEWDAYRAETQSHYTAAARTPEEQQLARDKADAYLREFETDARKGVMSRVVQRTYRTPASR